MAARTSPRLQGRDDIDDGASHTSTTVYDDAAPSTVAGPGNTSLYGVANGVPVPHSADELPVGCMNTLRAYWPAIKVGIFSLLLNVPGTITAPILVGAKADFFGSDQKAAMAQSIFDCSVAFINFFAACFYGRLLDSFGRRKFFIAAAVLQTASFACLTALPDVPIVYMIVHLVFKLVQSSYATAYLTDISTPSMRPKAFGISQAFGGFTLFASIFAGVIECPDRIFYLIGAISAGLALIFAIFLLPESLSLDKRTPLDCSAVRNPFKDIAVLFKSHVLKLCTAMLVLVQICDVGISDVYMFYLQSRVGFNKSNFSIMMFELAFLSPFIVLVIMPLLLNRLSPSLVLATALIGNAGAWIVVGTIWAKWPIFAIAIPMAAIVQMASPILVGLVVNAGDLSSAAKRLTAVVAISDLSSALGPLIFGITYAKLPGALQALPFFVGAGFCVIAAYLATLVTGALHKDVVREVVDEGALDPNGVTDALIAERTEARLRDALAPAGTDALPWEGKVPADDADDVKAYGAGDYRPPAGAAGSSRSSTRSSNSNA